MTERLHPTSLNEMKGILKEAHQSAKRVLPLGNESRIQRHRPGVDADIHLSLNAFQQIHFLDVQDQTCEVDAGLSPFELNQTLIEHGLELAIDAPSASHGTLGGLFLSPDISLLHATTGAPRDHVLGATWLLADGTVISTGGRVVKNVAGYDVTRLFLGSRGQLAICLRLCLRLRPIPSRLNWWASQDLKALSAPNIRLGISPEGSSHLWIQSEGVDGKPHPSCQERPFHEGQEIRDSVLSSFGSRNQRWALAGALGDWRTGAWDVLAKQTTEAPNLDSCQTPVQSSSPWLKQIARACCPAGESFAL